MGLSLGKWILYMWVLMISAHIISGQKGCFEEERKALLEFKAFVIESTSKFGAYEDIILPTWVDHSSECCDWERVTCNHTTGHITELSLDRILRSVDIDLYEINWNLRVSVSLNLNVSIFVPFKELQRLDLSANYFDGWVENKGSGRLSSLRNLEILDVSTNNFNKSEVIFPSVGAITSLKTLILGDNLFGGYFRAQDLVALRNLEMLDVSDNFLNGSLPMQDCESLSRLEKLETLYLHFNNIDKSILLCLSALPFLKNLDFSDNDLGLGDPFTCQEFSGLEKLKVLKLSGNYLNGSLTMGGWASFHNLEILDLSYNSFVGSIPPSFAGLSSLKALSLAWNELDVSSPPQGLCELKKLEELDLSGNHFDGTLPLCLSNLTSLRMLDLSGNQFNGSISPSLIARLTSLECINLSQNNFEGVFKLSSFSNHSKLEVIKISSTNQKFEVETGFSNWIPNFQLKALVLLNCNLNKLPIYFLLHQSNLRLLDLSHNFIVGNFPNWLLENNTELNVLDLHNNSLSGTLRLPLDMKLINLHWINLSENNFSRLVEQKNWQVVPNLSYLNLSRNAFEGDITPLFRSNMSNLEALDLSDNKFSGQIFLTTLNLPRIFVLDISNNLFSGTILSSTSNITITGVLAMSNNLFEGPFPVEIRGVMFLDISENSFSGSLPSFSSLESLRQLHLQGNRFSGSIPRSFSNLTRLLTLDMGDNSLSGLLPDLNGSLSNLEVLSLSRNQFTGFIPDHLCELTSVRLMDLSRNSVTGSIPQCFQNISFGSYTNYSSTIPYGFYYNSYTYTTSFLSYSLSLSAKNYIHEDEFKFVTKYRRDQYKGDSNLNFMLGLDLSCNNLTGKIPSELGMLSEIHTLNLSHNQLTGPIPTCFSNLTQMESLDLSFNRLSGQIPGQLIELNFLSIFNVAHNNLSGRLPEMKAQFGTFEASSYAENPFLCGPPLEKSCMSTSNNSPPSQRGPSGESEEEDDKWYEVDHVSFAASFVAAYTVFVFGCAVILYINPNWRRRWFNLVEECMYSCYYFLCDSLHKLSALLHLN